MCLAVIKMRKNEEENDEGYSYDARKKKHPTWKPRTARKLRNLHATTSSNLYSTNW